MVYGLQLTVHILRFMVYSLWFIVCDLRSVVEVQGMRVDVCALFLWFANMWSEVCSLWVIVCGLVRGSWCVVCSLWFVVWFMVCRLWSVVYSLQFVVRGL